MLQLVLRSALAVGEYMCMLSAQNIFGLWCYHKDSEKAFSGEEKHQGLKLYFRFLLSIMFC